MTIRDERTSDEHEVDQIITAAFDRGGVAKPPDNRLSLPRKDFCNENALSRERKATTEHFGTFR